MGSDTQVVNAVPETRWSLVSSASGSDSKAALKALNDLLRLYYPVLRQFSMDRFGLPHHKAEDLVQNFVAARILQGNILGLADRRRGRFRSFLLKVFSNYAFSEIRREHAQKRGPSESQTVKLDENPDLLSHTPGFDTAFSVAWARETIEEAIRRMQAECNAKRRTDVWGVFECRILLPTLEGSNPVPYEDVVRKFGFRSPSEASNALITARRMFVRRIKEVIRDTVSEEADVDAEIKELREILAVSGAGSAQELRSKQ